MNIFAQGSYSLFPKLHEAPRVARDIEQLLTFISRQPWGDPIPMQNIHTDL